MAKIKFPHDENDEEGSDEDSETNDGENTVGSMRTASTANGLAAGRRNWDESFAALKQFRKKFGSCLVPSAYEDDTALGHWVRKQRRNESSGRLSPDKRDKLDSVGFVWKLRGEQHAPPKPVAVASSSTSRRASATKKRTWTESFEALKAYKKKHGDCLVPRRYPEDLALGQWVSKQRLNQKDLTRRQRSRLECIGFHFETKMEKSQRAWDEKFEKLKAYKRRHGDCMVPQQFRGDPALFSWVGEQRRAFLKNQLPHNRMAKLEALGFLNEAESAHVGENDDSKDTGKDNSKDKRKDTGKDDSKDDNKDDGKDNNKDDSKDNSKDNSKDDSKDDSKDNKASTINREILSNAAKWSTNYRSLKAFQRRTGHCIISRSEDKTLNYWIQRQRQLNIAQKLKPERKELLDKINFEWYLGVNELPEHYFDEMIGRLMTFQQETGHVDVPKKYLRGGLGEWVYNLKTQGREGLLDPEQADRLLRVGFTWMEDRDCWLKNFTEVSSEVKQCRRNPNQPISFSSEVGNWLKVQHMLIDYDLLPPKRQTKLESLGLTWDGSVLSWAEGNVWHGQNDNSWLSGDLSSGFDLKDAALSWTPDKPVGRSTGKWKNDQSPGKDRKSPVSSPDVSPDAKKGTKGDNDGDTAPKAEEPMKKKPKLDGKTEASPKSGHEHESLREEATTDGANIGDGRSEPFPDSSVERPTGIMDESSEKGPDLDGMSGPLSKPEKKNPTAQEAERMEIESSADGSKLESAESNGKKPNLDGMPEPSSKPEMEHSPDHEAEQMEIEPTADDSKLKSAESSEELNLDGMSGPFSKPQKEKLPHQEAEQMEIEPTVDDSKLKSSRPSEKDPNLDGTPGPSSKPEKENLLDQEAEQMEIDSTADG